MNANRTMRSGPRPGKFQQVRIRNVSSKLMRRLKAVLAKRGETVGSWFLLVASRTANKEDEE